MTITVLASNRKHVAMVEVDVKQVHNHLVNVTDTTSTYCRDTKAKLQSFQAKSLPISAHLEYKTDLMFWTTHTY